MVTLDGIMGLSSYHLGPLEEINQTYNRMLEYSQAHHYKIGEESYERYVVDYWVTNLPEKFVTEVIIPIVSPADI
jgi:effector-binding domain-containing protein